ncbi:MAG TPA: glycosyltransferase family 39 protein [Planctomycetota bacterium]
MTAVKAVLAAVVPLSGDEAYFWECSRHLDWCYQEQPPLAIWAMIPARALLGDTVLAVRLPTLLVGAVLGWLLSLIVLRLGGTRRQAAVLWGVLHATPMFLIGSCYASTDALMMTAFAGATAAAMAIANGDRRGWWAFGVAVGLGFLAKFTVVLVLPALVPLLLLPQVRAQLRTPVPWLAALLCCALTAPVWIWAMQHDWDSIAWQLERVPDGFQPLHVVKFWGGSAAIVTPTLGVAALVAWFVSRRHGTASWRVLRWAAAAPIVFWSALAVLGPASAHWSAPSMLLGLVAVSLLEFPGRRQLVQWGVATGVVVLAAVASFLLLPEPWIAAEQAFRQWQGRPERAVLHHAASVDDLTAEVVRRLRPGELAASQRFSFVHTVSFLSQGKVPTLLYRGAKHGLSSLYWHSAEELRGRDLLVYTTDPALIAELRPLFASVEEEVPFEVRSGGKVVQVWRFLRCRNLQAPERGFTRLRT